MENAETEVAVHAPAKINLVLAVGAARRDGYHELATVFHAVSLHDTVVARPGDEITVTVAGARAAGVPTGEANLAARAAAVLQQETGVGSGVRLEIRKDIPVAAGLAGGSADAAAALVACDALWGTRLDGRGLAGLAARLGSDVPFALEGGTALGTGRGELLTPVTVGGTFHWVLAVTDAGLSTPAVYAELDRLRGRRPVPRPGVDGAVLTALGRGDPEALAATLRNDLQEAACSMRPALRETLEAGLRAGGLAGVVSGSGPTCAFLARDEEHGAELADRLARAGACSAVRHVRGPVPGARVA
ncbi:MAG: 4-(cytidine 5'-diphospho)-2-C-methyl-D-erythritol kinase [Actinomycetota bacterium]